MKCPQCGFRIRSINPTDHYKGGHHLRNASVRSGCKERRLERKHKRHGVQSNIGDIGWVRKNNPALYHSWCQVFDF